MSTLRMAYADPPYLGCAHLYKKVDAGATEVDHAELIARLVREYPDGWALSCSVPSLRTLLPMCPETVRVLSWVKPFAVFKPNVGLAYAWEPVILQGGRKRTRKEPTVRDWVSANITLRRGMPGAKPVAFCRWLFAALNLQPGDEFHDLYPGSGAVARAWSEWSKQPERLQLELSRSA